MEDLTPRQIELLKAIIAEYTESGEPVGSDILDKKFNLGVSPATIRNEMVELAKKNYLKKEYFSSGRVPTAQAFRFYINNLMNEKELSTAEEVAYKSAIWDFRDEIHRLLQHATQSLARKTGMLAVAITSNGDVYYFGIKNVLTNREFWDLDRAQCLFERFDEAPYWVGILDKLSKMEDEILFTFSEDDPDLDKMATVFGEFKTPIASGAIGVMGPRRMRYEVIVPTVRYCTQLIENVLGQGKTQ